MSNVRPPTIARLSQTPDNTLSDRVFSRKLGFATYSPVVSLSLLVLSMLALVWLLMWAMRWVDHTNRVIEQGWYVQKLTLDLQTATRGYLLTGDDKLLAIFRQSDDALPRAMDDLQILVADNQRQLGRVVRIRKTLDAWLTWSGSVFTSAQPLQGVAPTTQTLRDGNAIFTELRDDLANFLSEESALRQQRSDRVRKLTRIALIAAAIMTTGVAIWQCRTMRRRIVEVSSTYREALKLARERREKIRDLLQSLDKELRAVGEIQRSLLPIELPAIPGLDLAASYQTSSRAGGDYFDFFALPPLEPGGPTRFGILIADVSGHGTPAAVLMAVTHSIAHGFDQPRQPPSDLLAFVNKRLCKSYTNSTVAFVTAFYGIYDPATRVLTYSSAGHNPPRLRRAVDGWIELCDAQSLPLGVAEDAAYHTAAIPLDVGDTLVFYTDGITEARDEQTSFFGVERIDEAIDAIRNERDASEGAAQAMLDRVLGDLNTFAGTKAVDDQTLLIAEVVGEENGSGPRASLILPASANPIRT